MFSVAASPRWVSVVRKKHSQRGAAVFLLPSLGRGSNNDPQSATDNPMYYLTVAACLPPALFPFEFLQTL